MRKRGGAVGYSRADRVGGAESRSSPRCCELSYSMRVSQAICKQNPRNLRPAQSSRSSLFVRVEAQAKRRWLGSKNGLHRAIFLGKKDSRVWPCDRRCIRLRSLVTFFVDKICVSWLFPSKQESHRLQSPFLSAFIHPHLCFLSPLSFGPCPHPRQVLSSPTSLASMVSQLWAAADAGDAAQIQYILASSDTPIDIEARG